MASAQAYIDWIRRALAEPGTSPHDVRDALASGSTQCLGGSLPAEHFAEIAATLLPELEARIAELGPRISPPRPAPLWPDRSRAAEAALRARVAALPSAVIPRPFHRRQAFAVGGLLSAGFADGTEYVLVVSASGRGVFDAARLTKVGRDRDPIDVEDRVRGIPPIEGVEVPQMSTYGRVSLPRTTPDDWSLGVLSPEGDASVWLCAPSVDVEHPTPTGSMRFDKRFEEVRAAGFSASGNSLLIAEQHTIHLYHRS
jgi:hypothetical protein